MTKTRSLGHVQRATEALRDLIFSGALPPGSDHLETELADRLAMSRTPIREALLRLEAQGLVEVRPRRGARILPISVTDMREVYDLLTVLEGLAVERAASCELSEADLRPLARALDAMDRALQVGDRQKWAKADEAFHEALLGLANNRRLGAIVRQMSDQTRRARQITLHMRPWPPASNNDHRAVFNAIRAGHARSAGNLHRAHRRKAGEMLVALLDTPGLDQL